MDFPKGSPYQAPSRVGHQALRFRWNAFLSGLAAGLHDQSWFTGCGSGLFIPYAKTTQRLLCARI